MMRMQNPPFDRLRMWGDIIYKLPALLLVIALLQSQRHEHQQRKNNVCWALAHEIQRWYSKFRTQSGGIKKHQVIPLSLRSGLVILLGTLAPVGGKTNGERMRQWDRNI